jgi:hypothetical protein
MATAQTSELEIHLKDGLCKVIEGTARRTYFSTSEAVGLALLGMNQGSVTTSVKWMDFLASKGLAFGATGKESFTIMVIPEKEREISYQRGSGASLRLKVTYPQLIMAVRMINEKVNKTMFFVLKAGEEKKLTITSTSNVMAPFSYGNVYEHGGVCWGNTVIKDIVHPADVEGAFFESAFNGDLFHSSTWGGRDASFPELVERTGGKLPVPVAGQFTKSMVGVVQDIGRS